MLPTDAQKRKDIPVYTGFIKYFPDAIAAVAAHSFASNEQHNPGTECHWDRAKSTDEMDSLMRHVLDGAPLQPKDIDTRIAEASAVSWRAMAQLQKLCELREHLVIQGPSHADGVEFDNYRKRAREQSANFLDDTKLESGFSKAPDPDGPWGENSKFLKSAEPMSADSADLSKYASPIPGGVETSLQRFERILQEGRKNEQERKRPEVVTHDGAVPVYERGEEHPRKLKRTGDKL